MLTVSPLASLLRPPPPFARFALGSLALLGWWGDMGGPKQKGIYTYCKLSVPDSTESFVVSLIHSLPSDSQPSALCVQPRCAVPSPTGPPPASVALASRPSTLLSPSVSVRVVFFLADSNRGGRCWVAGGSGSWARWSRVGSVRGARREAEAATEGNRSRRLPWTGADDHSPSLFLLPSHPSPPPLAA